VVEGDGKDGAGRVERDARVPGYIEEALAVGAPEVPQPDRVVLGGRDEDVVDGRHLDRVDAAFYLAGAKGRNESLTDWCARSNSG
jgi:hypothetical protein